jgi:tetratricopeptide (TPR) repeat protein
LAGKYPGDFAVSSAQARTWLLDQVEDCEAGGEWAAAQMHLDRLVAAEPEDLGWRSRRARALFHLGRHEAAAADWTRVLESRPRDVAALLQRYRAYARWGQWDRALADSARVTQLEPDHATAWLLVSLAHARLGHEEAAAEAYARAEDQSQAVGLAAQTLWARRQRWPDLARAEAWEEAAVELSAAADAGVPGAWRALGLAHLALGRWERAAAEFGRALEQQPTDWQSRRGRGRALAELERWPEAVADWKELTARRPDLWDVWYSRGFYHAQQDEGQAMAVADWGRVLQLGIDTVDLRYQRATAAAKAGRWDEAAEDMGRAAEKAGQAFGPRHLHALFALAAGQRDAYGRACRALRDGLSGAEAERANAIAWVCVLGPDALPDYEGCMAALTKALAATPDNYQYLNTLGAVLCRTGRSEAAVQRLQQAVRVHGTGGTAWDWLFLALAHHRLGQATEARQALERALGWIRQAEQGTLQDRFCPTPLAWQTALELRLLRQEVEALVAPAGRP